jgi:hypothetical protein
MSEYMGDFIFDTFQPFHFYHNEEVDYRIPEDGPRDNYTGMSLSLLSQGFTEFSKCILRPLFIFDICV